jgi:hydroxymethylpyrimidine pyrophosphatase-like HAD family hydrolase
VTTATYDAMLALDIDGTLVAHDGRISPEAGQAIRKLDRSGVCVVLATGRSAIATIPVFHQIGLASIAVCSNGAVTAQVDPSRQPALRVLESKSLRPGSILDRLRARLPDISVAVEGTWLGFRVSEEFPPGELMGAQITLPWSELGRHDAIRITVRQPGGTASHIMDCLDELGIEGAGYDVLGRAWVDITPPGTSKASALEALRQNLNIAPQKTVACGDHLNDIEMLAWAHHSAAMGHAPSAVKEVADQILPGIAANGLTVLLDSLLAAQPY